ncbi:NrdR family transcriptional regulator [Lysinibacillus sp. 54212]|uniref:NrdR family transcriptional regulator n=1 Tax=Lysinibacillus sp. 54212 TaxID=3119829 RepID=UPI003FA55BF7
MKCPECGIVDRDNRVVDSRHWKHTIRRKRKCNSCGYRWHTYEAMELEYFSDRNRNKYLPWTPGEERTAVVLIELEGKSYTYIATVLCRSRMSVQRKIEKLRATDEYLTILEDIREAEQSGASF